MQDWNSRQRTCVAAWLIGAGWVGIGVGPAQAQGIDAQAGKSTLVLDASAPFVAAGPADYQGGASRRADGQVLGVTDRYLTLDGKPWIPVMGEMHFSRVPEAEWENDILRMKTAGVNVISTYIIWIHHEEVQGQWDWTGQKDLRHFAELCAKHGMLLYPRIGPWAHAEVRNGGFPDWVVKAGPTRELNPTFMAETKTFYEQTAEQLKGLLWKDGGPVIGVQIENEYGGRGPDKGEAYLLALKKLAVASGFDVPLYSVTGWDGAAVPKHEFLPVYGGYPSAPWDGSRGKLAPEEVFVFRFGSRVSGSMGMIGTGGKQDKAQAEGAPKTPFLTAEVGGGGQDTYHRRPLLDADDIAAMMPVMLGSGVNLYGTYMFTGGQNPDGRLSTLQESQRAGSATDVPVKSYDFEAPIGEYGLERASLRAIKNWNYFMQDFGEQLAPMPVFAPQTLPVNPADLSVVRWSVRTNGHAGFLFANNYVRGQQMPTREGVQFQVKLPQGKTLNIPAKPITIPADAYFAWPFGLDLGGTQLRYATAQMVAKLPGADGTTYAMACLRGMRCEVVLEGTQLALKVPQDVTRKEVNGATVLTRAAGAAGERSVIEMDGSAAAGKQVRLVLLSPQAALESWKVRFGGAERLLATRADIFADEAAGGQTTVTLRQLSDPTFTFSFYPSAPATAQSPAGVALKAAPGGNLIVHLPPVNVSANAVQTKPAGTVPPVELGPALSWRPRGVPEAPTETTWQADAAQWKLALKPDRLPAGVSGLFLNVAYAGDEARLMAGDRLLDDNFFNGAAWMVGLDRYVQNGTLPGLTLQLLPMRGDAPVFLEPEARAKIAPEGQTVVLEKVSLLPQYQLVVEQ